MAKTEDRACDEARVEKRRGSRSPAAVTGGAADSTSSSPLFIPSCCGTVEAPGAPEHPITVLRNIPYYEGDGVTVRHQLDIYFSLEAIAHHREACAQAEDGHDRVPTVIHVHGGGWQRGDRANEWRGSPNAGRAIARHGMIGVCPSYRLSAPAKSGAAVVSLAVSTILVILLSLLSSWVRREFLFNWALLFAAMFVFVIGRGIYSRNSSRHPESAIDVCRVVKWVREHLHEHVEIADLERVFLCGHSAGAHLVSLVSVDPRYYQQVGLADTSFVRGVCAVSGVYSLYNPVHRDPHAFKNLLFRATYGAAAFGRSRAELVDASPITHVRAGAPPFLVMSATRDMGLEVDAAVFIEKLAQVGVPYEHHVIQKTSHSTIASHFEKHQAHRHLFQFINKCCDELQASS